MLYYFVIVPVFLAVLLYLFSSLKIVRTIGIIAQFSLFLVSAYLFYTMEPGEYISVAIGGFESILGVWLRADTLSSVFLLLTTFLFLIGSIYSFKESKSGLFWFLMFLWEASLIGIFLTGDLFNIFVLVEVGTVVVSIIILYNRANRSLYDGMIYLMINTVIIQFYMIGVGLIYRLTGGLDLVHVQNVFATMDSRDLVLPYALLMTFVALKCALMPLYSWLPKAHGTTGAPAAASALLSGLHIKSGVYLFLRFQEMFEPIATFEIFLVIGVITAIAGVIMALAQTDIKLILAYSTVAQIGLIIVGLSVNTVGSYNYIGALYHILNHAIFKAALFLSAGVLAYAYGTRKLADIRGVFKVMPMLAIAKILAILGIVGTPLFNGNISKYFLMSGLDFWLNTVLIIVNLGTITIFIKYSTIFFGKPKEQLHVKTDLLRHGPILILGVLCFVGGIFGVWSIEFLFNYTVYVDLQGYIEKTVIFFISLGIGYLIYKYYVEKSEFLKKVKEIDFCFRTMCLSIGIFMAVILITVGFGSSWA